MATLFVDKVDPQSGTSLEIGSSGDTITIPSGATITNNGTQTGFGGTNTPAFQANLSASQNLGGNNTWTKVAFNEESFDTNSDYDNSSNYRFTPTVSGKYMIYAHCQLSATAVDRNGISEIAIYKNNSSIAQSIIDPRQASSEGGHRFTCTINLVVEPNGSGDYYEIFARCFDNSGATGTLHYDNDGSNVFGAYKIIE